MQVPLGMWGANLPEPEGAPGATVRRPWAVGTPAGGGPWRGSLGAGLSPQLHAPAQPPVSPTLSSHLVPGAT